MTLSCIRSYYEQLRDCWIQLSASGNCETGKCNMMRKWCMENDEEGSHFVSGRGNPSQISAYRYTGLVHCWAASLVEPSTTWSSPPSRPSLEFVPASWSSIAVTTTRKWRPLQLVPRRHRPRTRRWRRATRVSNVPSRPRLHWANLHFSLPSRNRAGLLLLVPSHRDNFNNLPI